MQKKSWLTFKVVVFGFLGNNKAKNYQELVKNILRNFKAMDFRHGPLKIRGQWLKDVSESAYATGSFR